jgi:hypothetical protein
MGPRSKSNRFIFKFFFLDTMIIIHLGFKTWVQDQNQFFSFFKFFLGYYDNYTFRFLNNMGPKSNYGILNKILKLG